MLTTLRVYPEIIPTNIVGQMLYQQILKKFMNVILIKYYSYFISSL